jgi:ABC-2 type transport system permease protein
LRFEFTHYARSKVYIVVTAVLVILIAGLLTYPRFSGLFREKGNKPGERVKIALVDRAYGSDDIYARLAQAYPSGEIVPSGETVEQLKEKVAGGEYKAAVILESPLKFTYLTETLTMYENPTEVIGTILKEKYQTAKLYEMGVGAADAAVLVNPTVESSVIQTGKSQAETFIYTYVLIYALYMFVVLYGQFVASSVASEKSSRAMELLITSASPASLMFGKIIGTGLAGLLQFGIIFGSAFLFYNINSGLWAENHTIEMIFNIPLDLFLYVLLFFVLGFFLYAFIYGALGSLASRSEDVGAVIMPVTFLFIIAFFVVIFGMSTARWTRP